MMDRLRALGRALVGRSQSLTATVDTQLAESGGTSSYDAGKKVKGRKRHLAVEGFLIEIAIQEASVQDRDGAPVAVLGMLEPAPLVRKLRADGGYRGPQPTSARKELGLGSVLEIVEKPKDAGGVAVVCWPLGRRASLRLNVALPTSG